MISGEICGVIFFLAKKPTFDQWVICVNFLDAFTAFPTQLFRFNKKNPGYSLKSLLERFYLYLTA